MKYIDNIIVISDNILDNIFNMENAAKSYNFPSFFKLNQCALDLGQ